jgi:hypothetical protein
MAETINQNITLQRIDRQLQIFVATQNGKWAVPNNKTSAKLQWTSSGNKKCKYVRCYLSLRFLCNENIDALQVQCMVCCKILSNSSLAPA